MARKKRAPENEAITMPKPLVGGRLSRDADSGLRFNNRLSAIVPPASVDETWRTLDLDAHTLSRISPVKLADYLADISPEVSRAIWDFVRECNAGHEIIALIPGAENPDTRAQDVLDGFLTTLGSLYGTLDVPINRLFLSIFMRGAICSELVLDASGRVPVDLAVMDPAVVRAKRVDDPVRGTIFEYGQMVGGQWVAFDRPTISYIPVDPLPASPYGRALISPAIFTSLFLIGLLHDLRRVIAQQGYPRYDIEIVLDEALKQMPTAARTNPAAQEAWLNSLVTSIAAYYADLQPDSAFTHTSAVKLNRPISAVDTQSLGGIAPILEALERMASRSLKSVPFLMGLAQNSSEATANREWEAHLQGIKAIQHIVENQLSHLFTLALQAQGIVSKVVVTFAENRASEMFRDLQSERLRVDVARSKYDNGWISQDAAALEGAGVNEADESEPRQSASAVVPDPNNLGEVNPTPGENRATPTNGHVDLTRLTPEAGPVPVLRDHVGGVIGRGTGE